MKNSLYLKLAQAALEYMLVIASLVVITITMINFFYGLFDEGLVELAKTFRAVLASGNGFLK